MKTIKPFEFSFKSEPMWMLVFALGPGALALVIVLLLIWIVKLAG
jgi:hypothetical protein